MENFIKIHSYNGEVHIVNIASIAHIKIFEKKPVITLKTVDKDNINIQIIDTIKSYEFYKDLLIKS